MTLTGCFFFSCTKMSCLILAMRPFHNYYLINVFENLISCYFMDNPNKSNTLPKVPCLVIGEDWTRSQKVCGWMFACKSSSLPLPLSCPSLPFQSEDHSTTSVMILPKIPEFNNEETLFFSCGIFYKIIGYNIQKCEVHESQGKIEGTSKLKETKETQQPMQRMILHCIFCYQWHYYVKVFRCLKGERGS